LTIKGSILSLLLQGAGKYDVLVSNGIMPGGTVKYLCHCLRKTGGIQLIMIVMPLLPRVSATGNVNNTKHSDFWYIDGTYLRIKNFNLGYTIPMGDKVGIDSMRLFLSGTKIFLTFSELNKWGYGSGSVQTIPTGRYYPQPKTFSLGVSIKL